MAGQRAASVEDARPGTAGAIGTCGAPRVRVTAGGMPIDV